MKKLVFIMVLFLVAGGLFSAQKALLIGNSVYKGITLSAPANDVALMANALGSRGFSVVTKYNLNLGQMRAVADTFAAQISAEDDVIFYYSGYGAHGEGSHNYLMPAGMDIGAVRYPDYDRLAFFINAYLPALKKARSSAVILESNRTWPLPDGKKLNLSFVWMGAVAKNQMLVYATLPDLPIPDETLETSYFTSHLAEEINAGAGSLNSVIAQLKNDLPKLTKNQLRPWSTNPLEPDLVFVEQEQAAPSVPFKSEIEGGGSISW